MGWGARAQFFPPILERMNLGVCSSAYAGLYNFTLKVLETDYNEYAFVIRRVDILNSIYFQHILYGESSRHPLGDLVTGIFIK